MEKERIRFILSGLKKFELTEAEKRFVSFVEQGLNDDGVPFGILESILETIYTEKTEFIRDSILSMLKESRSPVPIYQ